MQGAERPASGATQAQNAKRKGQRESMSAFSLCTTLVGGLWLAGMWEGIDTGAIIANLGECFFRRPG